MSKQPIRTTDRQPDFYLGTCIATPVYQVSTYLSVRLIMTPSCSLVPPRGTTETKHGRVLYCAQTWHLGTSTQYSISYILIYVYIYKSEAILRILICDKEDSILNIRSTYLLVHYFVLSPKDVAFGGYGNVKSGSDSISHY
jgi:hypothetical protein